MPQIGMRRVTRVIDIGILTTGVVPSTNIDKVNDNNIESSLNRGLLHGNRNDETYFKTEESSDGLKSCIFRKQNIAQGSNQFLRFSNLDGNLFLGSFIKGDSVLRGNFASYVLPNNGKRKPMPISVDILGLHSQVVEEVSLSHVNDTLGDILGDTKIESFNLSSYSSNVSTKGEFLVKFGFNQSAGVPAEIMTLLAKLPLGLESTADLTSEIQMKFERKQMVFNYNLVGYTASVGVAHPNDLHDQDHSEIAGDALYLSSIIYGRRIYILVDNIVLSERVLLEFEIALEATIKGVGTTSNQEALLKELLEYTSSKVTIIAIGVNTQSTVFEINDIADLERIVSKLSSSVNAKTMSPIAYKLSFLDGGGFASLHQSTESLIPYCSDITTLYEVSIHKITAKRVVDWLGDEEIYGEIKLNVSYRNSNGITEKILPTENGNQVFSHSSGSFTSLKEGQSITVNKSRVFNVPKKAQRTLKFEIETDLKDKILQDGEHFGNSHYSVSYSGSETIHLSNIGSETRGSFICQEDGGDAKLEVFYTIKAIS